MLLGARLAAAGHQVLAGARDAASARRQPSTWQATDHDGTVVRGDVACLGSPKGIKGVDVLVLATKCDDAPDALRRWLPCLAPRGAAVCLQNGIMGDTLADIAKDRLVECTVSIPATLNAPGDSEQTGPGGLIIGPWPDQRMTDATPLEVAKVLQDAAPLRIHMDMQGVKWTKLLINSAITGLGALTGEPLGRLMDDARARTAFIHIISEGYRIGISKSVRFQKVAGFHPRLVATTGKPSRAGLWRRHLILRFIGRKYRRQRSSSLQSLDRGRPTEVHHLNGHLAASGDAPVSAAVATLVARIEAGEAQCSLDHLDALPLQFH